MVSTDADDVISVRNVLKRQYGSPKIHGYARQIVYSSGGRPATMPNAVAVVLSTVHITRV